jgi:hypothetical protein
MADAATLRRFAPVRPEAVEADELGDLLRAARRLAAPKRLRRAVDAAAALGDEVA